VVNQAPVEKDVAERVLKLSNW